MHEHQSHPALWLDRDVQLAILVVELRLPTGEVRVQVDHERQLAAFSILLIEIAIKMWRKPLTRLVPVETKPVVQANSAPPLDMLGQKSFGTPPPFGRERAVVHDEACI